MRLLALLLSLWALACQSPVEPVYPTGPSVEVLAVRQMFMDYDGDLDPDNGCTAWHVREDLWVTAKHCTEADEDGALPLMWFGSKNDPSDPATIAACSTTADVCVLRGAVTGASLTLGSLPAFGDRVHYIGWPYYDVFHPGVYEGRWARKNADGEYEFTAFTDGGASGSPLMAEDGSVVGIVVASYRGRPYSYAVPVVALRQLLLTI